MEFFCTCNKDLKVSFIEEIFRNGILIKEVITKNKR